MQINNDFTIPQTVTRLDATREQIDSAIDLFSRNHIVAAITLAASAEHVLSDMSKSLGIPTFFERFQKDFESIHSSHGGSKSFYAWRQEIYDWLRHADRQPEQVQVISPDEALMLIMAAITTYLGLGGQKTVAMETFYGNWQRCGLFSSKSQPVQPSSFAGIR
jgi:hypothetical protein